jgi:hypothetical protein
VVRQATIEIPSWLVEFMPGRITGRRLIMLYFSVAMGIVAIPSVIWLTGLEAVVAVLVAFAGGASTTELVKRWLDRRERRVHSSETVEVRLMDEGAAMRAQLLTEARLSRDRETEAVERAHQAEVSIRDDRLKYLQARLAAYEATVAELRRSAGETARDPYIEDDHGPYR